MTTAAKPRRRRGAAKPKPKLKEALSRDEMIVILEEIARDGSDTARIQAIKTLLRLQDGSDDVGDDDLDKLIQAN
jgi:hypothetical protein